MSLSLAIIPVTPDATEPLDEGAPDRVSRAEQIRHLVAQAKAEGDSFARDFLTQLESLVATAKELATLPAPEIIPVGVKEKARALAENLPTDILTLKKLLGNP